MVLHLHITDQDEEILVLKSLILLMQGIITTLPIANQNINSSRNPELCRSRVSG